MSLLSIGFNAPFNEAIQATVARKVVLPNIYYGQLQGIHRQLAFSVAGLTSVNQLQGVLDSLTASLNTGGTFAEWQKTITVKELGLPKHRLDNIFRTNIQQAYNHGHWQQQLANQLTRPFLLYDAINDSRTRPSHKANDGIIRKMDDPIWKRIWFSRNVYRCRCRLISLTEEQAIARSKEGTGIYKVATEDPLRDKAWDSVDVMNADVLSFGVERAITERMTAGKVDKVLLSALNKKLTTLPDMKIVNTESFAPIQKTVAELAVKQPHWFPDGFNGIYAVENSNMFAATSQGVIYFSTADSLVAGFKPAIELANAVGKIGVNNALSFNEEYALESLWHEMKHISYQHETVPKVQKINSAVEGILQFGARHSYQELLSTIGMTATHQKKVIASGYAYDNEVRNFRTLLAELKLDEVLVADVVDNVFKRNTDINALINELAIALSTLTPHSAEKISYGLKSLERQSGFKEKIVKKLNY